MPTLLIEDVALILIILVLVMIANKLKVAYPIVLVIGGGVLGFISSFSHVSIEPDLVFFIFLPPLLYEAAWRVSWKEFWKWRRVIVSFAFPIVVITACVIAVFSTMLIPGFTLALGFLLGGIVSPTDAVSSTTIMRQVEAPKRLISVSEGESLLNDASSLIIFRYALAAVITGQFILQEAVINFMIVVTMGILIGVATGWIFYGIHRLLPTTASIEIVLTLVTPYCMYYFAEYFHFSGVLSVVSGGLLLSNKRQSILLYESRIQGVNVWINTVFVLNGLVFLLIGLQLPSIIKQLGDISLWTAIIYAVTISFVLIITRLICTLAASPFTRFMSHFIKVADPDPGWRTPLIFGWAGMRGVVSLAAALSVPVMISDSESFPYRNLILFITFIVILITLVFQGLTLPFLIKKVKPEKDDYKFTTDENQEAVIQIKIAQASLEFLEMKYQEEIKINRHVNILYQRMKTDIELFNRDVKRSDDNKDNSLKSYHKIYLELLYHQRTVLDDLNRNSEYDEELIRKYSTLIDLEELYTREKL
jgi:CPA1 family monovalent cation:H+ antiporter